MVRVEIGNEILIEGMFKQNEEDSGWCRLIIREDDEYKVAFILAGETNGVKPPFMSVEEYLKEFPKHKYKDQDKKEGPYINYSNGLKYGFCSKEHRLVSYNTTGGSCDKCRKS